MSTHPGVTRRPSASTVRVAERSSSRPTAVTIPPSTATSAVLAGLPVPSTTDPPRMTRSCTPNPLVATSQSSHGWVALRNGRGPRPPHPARPALLPALTGQRFEQVPVVLDPAQDLVGGEPEEPGVLGGHAPVHLVPRHRRGHGGLLAGPERVHGNRCLGRMVL